MKRTLGFIVASLASLCAFAETPNPNQALIDAKARLEAQTQLLTAETELLKAKIGTFPTGKEGTITQGTAVAYPIGATERVYARMPQLAQDVCDAVNAIETAKGRRKIVLGAGDLLSVMRYRMVAQEIALLEQDVPGAREAKTMGFAAIGPVLGAVESISKLFRSDLTIATNTTAIDPRYFQDRVATCLGVEASYPALAAQEALLLPGKSGILTKLDKLVAGRARVKQEHAAAVAKKDTEKAAQLDAVLQRIERLVTSLVTIPTGQTQPPLVDVLLGEAVAKAVGGDDQALILTVHLADQGGMSMIEKRSFMSDRLYVGGGAIATYRLTSGNWLLASGAVAQVDPDMKRVRLK